MLHKKRKLPRLLKAINSGIFAVAMLAFFTATTSYAIVTLTTPVYIVDGDDVKLTFTMSTEPAAILKENGIITMAGDAIDFTGLGPNDIPEINIRRAFELYLTVDGERLELSVPGGTVEELLETAGVTLGKDDILSHPPGMYVAPEDEIVIIRREIIVETHTEVIPFEVEIRPTSLLKPGKTRLLQSGENGERLITQTTVYEDGELVQQALETEEIILSPTKQITLKGVYGTPVSSLDFGPLDENGVPLTFSAVYTEQIATGYSARNGAWGASGMNLFYGYVAVNPAKIPYGTKMYIASPDNSFVYGYAVAADTGTGLLGGVIDVDLFYETYDESCLNGRRSVSIYILDESTEV